MNASCTSPAPVGSSSIIFNVRLSGRSLLSADASAADRNDGTDRPALCPDARARLLPTHETMQHDLGDNYLDTRRYLAYVETLEQ